MCDLEANCAGVRRNLAQLWQEPFRAMTLIDFRARRCGAAEQPGVLVVDGPAEQAQDALERFDFPA